MGELIYLDYNATTPVDPAVLDEMLPWFSERFWNAASVHPPGRLAADAVELARERFAACVGARPTEVVFTSGATEADNLGLKGAVEAAPRGRTRVVVAATEHKAVLDTAAWLSERGSPLTVLPVARNGLVEPHALAEALDESVAVVSVMLANNETGVIAPVQQLAEMTHECGAVFHTDATQALGRVPIDLESVGADLASFSGHKVYGPKGVGVLYIARGTPLLPTIHGGGHERGLRSGTMNVPSVVGLGVAAELAVKMLAAEVERESALATQLVATLRSRLAGIEWIAEDSPRLPNTINMRFIGADADAVIANTPDVAVSSGSACTSMVPSPSHVLLAMGLGADAADECLRISIGRPTSRGDVDIAAQRLADAVDRIRSLNN